MKKADFIIIGAALLIIGIIFLLSQLNRADVDAEDMVVQVYYDGTLYDSCSLMEDKKITVETELGKNVILISNGSAIMIEADCNDSICIDSGAIDSVGEYIVCLPHKVHVEITGSGEGDIDAISQ